MSGSMTPQQYAVILQALRGNPSSASPPSPPWSSANPPPGALPGYGMKAVPLPQGTPAATYFPNQSYVARNLAPEQYPMASLDALAQAHAAATKAGVLSPGLAKYFLANQLVENRPHDFAMNDPVSVTPGQRDPYAIWAPRLGLPEAYQSGSGHADAPNARVYDVGDSASLSDRAKLSAMFLAAKPGATPEAQIRAWNGAGPGADNHLAKVQAMQQALQILPQNRDLVTTYQRLVDQYSKPPPVDQSQQAAWTP